MFTRTFPESLEAIESVTSLETEKRTPTVTPTMYLGYHTIAIPFRNMNSDMVDTHKQYWTGR